MNWKQNWFYLREKRLSLDFEFWNVASDDDHLILNVSIWGEQHEKTSYLGLLTLHFWVLTLSEFYNILRYEESNTLQMELCDEDMKFIIDTCRIKLFAQVDTNSVRYLWAFKNRTWMDWRLCIKYFRSCNESIGQILLPNDLEEKSSY